MEQDFIKCMLFITFIIVILYIIIISFLSTNKLPFHIPRSLLINVDNKDVVPENLSFNNIPATVYQLYNNSTNVTNDVINTLNSNVSNNDEFEYYLLNSNDGRLFIKQHYETNLLSTYDSLSVIDKNNLLKYCILYKNGGVYMDFNLELKEKLIDIITPLLPSLLKNNNVIFTKNNNLISNKFIISQPGLPIFRELIDSYLNNNIVKLTSLINKYNYDNNIKLYVDDKSIKNIETNEICIYIK
jgi:mannosyltransferase OCH1-like enzyme